MGLNNGQALWLRAQALAPVTHWGTHFAILCHPIIFCVQICASTNVALFLFSLFRNIWPWWLWLQHIQVCWNFWTFLTTFWVSRVSLLDLQEEKNIHVPALGMQFNIAYLPLLCTNESRVRFTDPVLMCIWFPNQASCRRFSLSPPVSLLHLKLGFLNNFGFRCWRHPLNLNLMSLHC